MEKLTTAIGLDGYYNALLERISSYIGFEARYIIYPFIALIAGAAVKLIIRRYARKWAKKTKSELDDQIVAFLDNMTTPLVLMAILYGLSRWLPLPGNSVLYLQKGILIVIVFMLAYIVSRLISTTLAFFIERNEGWQKYFQSFHTLSKAVCIVIAGGITLSILDINMSSDGKFFIRIFGILAGAYVVMRIVRLAVSQMEYFVKQKDGTALEAQKRASTLSKIINSAALVIIVSVAIMMILSELNINITPIITGAGIVGLAVGFGAQNLVRDIISGFFLILEDQIRVGDVAKINGTGGVVEAIKLRTTILRDTQGIVYIFPNGEIKQVANLTKEYSYYVIDVGIAYKENVDTVLELLKQIGEKLANDPEFSPVILAPLEVLGVDNFADSQVTIKIRIKTLPLQQWTVGRELRRRIKNTFDERNIEMPFPHMSIYFGQESKPFEVIVRKTAEANIPAEGTK